MRKLLVLTTVLAMSSAAMGVQDMAGGYIQPAVPGSITIDGNFSEWGAIDWLDYGSLPGGEMENAKITARWTPAGMYIAGTVDDDDQFNGPPLPGGTHYNWVQGAFDCLEIYWNSDNVNGTSTPPGFITAEAQMYALGDGKSVATFFLQATEPNDPGPWDPPAWPDVPLPNGAYGKEGVTKVDGIAVGYTYEAFLPALDNTGLLASVLTAGDTVGLDFTFSSGDEVNYMAGLPTNPDTLHGPGGAVDAYDSGPWASYTLVPEPITMTFLGLGGLALIRRKR